MTIEFIELEWYAFHFDKKNYNICQRVKFILETEDLVHLPVIKMFDLWAEA